MNRLELYRVEDYIPPGDALRVVFLLESPHDSEVIHNHPLAGSSGIEVTDWLISNVGDEFCDLNSKTPFGCYLKAGHCSKVGLMNCSRLPMNKSIYSCSLGEGDKETVSGLNLIRENPNSSRRRELSHANIELGIIADLTSRLSVLTRSVLIVPCGELARNMVQNVGLTLNFYARERRVPHPSYNQWNDESNNQVMNALRDDLRAHLVL